MCPDSAPTMGQCWANVGSIVGPTLANDVGPTEFCPAGQHWCQHGTPSLGQPWTDIGPTLVAFVEPTMVRCRLKGNKNKQKMTDMIIYLVMKSFLINLNHYPAGHWHPGQRPLWETKMGGNSYNICKFKIVNAPYFTNEQHIFTYKYYVNCLLWTP